MYCYNYDFSGFPSPPQNIRQTTSIGQQNYIVTVQWDPPLYDGSTPVEYHMYTVRTNSSQIVTLDLKYTFILATNSVVSVSVYAHNCVGESNSVTLYVDKGIAIFTAVYKKFTTLLLLYFLFFSGVFPTCSSC